MIRHPFVYQLGLRFRNFHYLTRSSARVPIGIETDKGLLGVIPILADKPSLTEQGAGNSFLKTYAKSKILFVSQENKKIALLIPRQILVPAVFIA